MSSKLSAYERERLAKIERNKLAMASFGLMEAKEELQRKRLEEKAARDAERKQQKAMELESFVPRRTTRDKKPIHYIQNEWEAPGSKQRRLVAEIQKRALPPTGNLKDACLLCGLRVARPAMRQHIGAHIVAEGFSAVRCGLCGLELSACEHKRMAGYSAIVPIGKELCPKFHRLNLKTAERAKCTNVPLRCIKCRKWFWTYTMQAHMNQAHGGVRGLTKHHLHAFTISRQEIDAMVDEMAHIKRRLLEEEVSDSDDDGDESDSQVVRSYRLRERKPIVVIDDDDDGDENEVLSISSSDVSSHHGSDEESD
ncbi:hypothetical protein AC1031_005906 [Aphanomyces cochlioides]|nr:hypothetical protein AC1031_005906 [Aphanomyces cochlioides]